jgi:transposase InsO family protein
MANAALDAQIAAIHEGSDRSYGRPRIVRSLRDCGIQASHERVRNSLNRQGLRAVYRRRYRVTTKSEHSQPIARNVLDRRFDGWQLNQAWVGDITYVETGGLAVSGVRDGLGESENRGLVDERSAQD